MASESKTKTNDLQAQPRIDGSLPARHFFRALSANGAGGAFVSVGGKDQYVLGRDLGAAIEKAAERGGRQRAAARPTASYLASMPASSPPLLKSAEETVASGSVAAPAWFCEDGDENSEPDDYCAECPRKIVRMS